MIIELPASQGGASAMALGIGVWVFFGWCLVTCPAEKRLDILGAFGLVVAAGFAGGMAVGEAMGNRGLSSIGGLVGAGVALSVLETRLTKGIGTWSDHLIPGGLAGLAVARVGCLFDGCDFGRQAESGIRVVHGAGSRAREIHATTYGLPPQEATSFAVHPFAFYLASWAVFAALMGEWMRRRGDRRGGAGLASATIFLVGGGVIEWFREPQTVIQLTQGISAYPFIYWLGALATGWWWWSNANNQETDNNGNSGE